MKVASMNMMPPEAARPEREGYPMSAPSAQPVRGQSLGERASVPGNETAATREPLPNERSLPLKEEEERGQSFEQVLEEANQEFENLNYAIRFQIDDQSSEVVVKVVDKDSGEVIKQIPPEELVRMRERFDEIAGHLVEEVV